LGERGGYPDSVANQGERRVPAHPRATKRFTAVGPSREGRRSCSRKAGNGKLLLFHVIAPVSDAGIAEGMGLPSVPRKDSRRYRLRKAGRVLAAAGKKVKAAKVPVSKAWAISGSPHDAIVDIAKRRRCDLIVMASHGRKGLSRLLLGSETQAVLSRVSVPVLVVR
jgi:nucleotide-binding universal stress UspA family protein